eukprot:scaffold79748_cov23-Tisochrysis_lutea.AAC.1
MSPRVRVPPYYLLTWIFFFTARLPAPKARSRRWLETPRPSMPVRLRLQRFGKLHKPFYHIVAADNKAPRDGKHFEKLGTYDPIPDRYGNKHVRFDVERVYHWIRIGAEPTETVAKLLSRAQILPPVPRRGLLPSKNPRPSVPKEPIGSSADSPTM